MSDTVIFGDVKTHASAIMAFFDEGSPVAFVPTKRSSELRFVGLRDSELDSGVVEVGILKNSNPSPGRVRIIGDDAFATRAELVAALRGAGATVSDVGEDIPGALKAKFVDMWLADDPNLWRRWQDWFRINLPYAYIRLRDGSWLALNRNYKPLGLPREPWVDYEDFRDNAEIFDGDPADYPGIWTYVDPQRNSVWLYDDNSHSRHDYFSRLLRLNLWARPSRKR